MNQDFFSVETTLNKVKKGDFIKLKNTPSAPVWIRGAFERSSGKYSLISFEDSCKEIFRKGSIKCFIDFDF